MNYEDLIIEAENEGIEIYESNYIGKLKGLYVDNTITINSGIKDKKEKVCILAEELGHYHTSYGNIVDQSDIRNRKQERFARAWSYKKLVGITKLIKAFESGVSNRYELAEFLNVTEEFIEEALEYYKQKYGLYFKIDNYVVYFEPLGIMEMWE
ncbi:MAG: ImmA/IrrE family metallo-endopeptidase [Tissierellaceae bacterium]|nr:ImmA/IrrE family metallo-endopeptidase [Tissierellaceae bacterium]